MEFKEKSWGTPWSSGWSPRDFEGWDKWWFARGTASSSDQAHHGAVGRLHENSRMWKSLLKGQWDFAEEVTWWEFERHTLIAYEVTLQVHVEHNMAQKVNKYRIETWDLKEADISTLKIQ